MNHPALHELHHNYMANSKINQAAKVHLNSFNYILHKGLRKAYRDIDPVCATFKPSTKFYIDNVTINKMQHPTTVDNHCRIQYPYDCRMRGETYSANLNIQLGFETDGYGKIITDRTFSVPLMVKSDLCSLSGVVQDELKLKEDENDPGGYFIIKGKEYLLRLFSIQRRNYPLGLVQLRWKSHIYTEFGVMVRSVKNEHEQSEVILHYLKNRTIELKLSFGSLSLALLLKALIHETDAFIIKELTFCEEDDDLKRCILVMIQQLSLAGICTHQQAIACVAEKFAKVARLPDGSSAEEITNSLFQRYLLIHLKNNDDKFRLLWKLFALSKGTLKSEDQDNPVYQEVLTSGQVYLMLLKEEMCEFLESVKRCFTKEMRNKDFNAMNLLDAAKRSTSKAYSITAPMQSFIATGNVILRKRYGFKSSTGFSILLDRINVLQFLSYFTCINKFSMQFYSTSMRKFYPESWGFLCPVQTPEGNLTSLQNHLAIGCEVISPFMHPMRKQALHELGMIPHYDHFVHSDLNLYCVLLDGNFVGWVPQHFIEKFVESLILLRGHTKRVPVHAEIIFARRNKNQLLYPGIYIFSTPNRMMRSVCDGNTKEHILMGTFEQQVSVIEVQANQSSHYVEIDDINFLGLSALSIPFLQNNPAIRNTFSCMKSKQAIGVPLSKLNCPHPSRYQQLVYPQSPLIVTDAWKEFGLDQYPFGVNLVIAVVAYSGFDMEDAIVINRASVQRGLMMDVVRKTLSFELPAVADELGSEVAHLLFKRDPEDDEAAEYLDEDGLPYVGSKVSKGSPLCSIFNCETKAFYIKSYDGTLPAQIQSVELQNCLRYHTSSQKLAIRISYKRLPEVGDKFATRHGQKGICGALWAPEDMPFAASGVAPDVLFNPHGLPSRMSVGMLLEIMSCKVACVEACRYSHRPFQCSQDRNLVTCLGEKLQQSGFDFHGTEVLSSGISGNELEANIFCGVVYYERLRQLVEEKYQVCSLGRKDAVTGQPAKASRSGAIRFGEMERDSVLSHGAAALLQDRLHWNSDACTAWVCGGCSCLLNPAFPGPLEDVTTQNEVCRFCGNSSQSFAVSIPSVFVYLVAELAVCNIKTKLFQ